MHLLLCAALLLFQPAALPAAHFSGKVHTVTKKLITVDTEEGNEVEFTINRKTKVERAGKAADPQSLKPGEQVSVDAEQKLLGYLVALKITLGAAPAH
jgi:cold shock CspA family protein